VEEKKYKVIFTPSAQRDIEALETVAAIQLARDIKTYLEITPLPFGKSRIKKITGYNPPLYRLRSGDYRAYYRIVSREVVVVAITNKKDSEKLLKKLK
jgi:mRNA-degrading endonuclease RelE of RelBE toxin-antitoxin system